MSVHVHLHMFMHSKLLMDIIRFVYLRAALSAIMYLDFTIT